MRYYFLGLGTLLIVCVGCAVDGQQLIKNDDYHAPPSQMLAQPGPMVDLARPGVMSPLRPPGGGIMPTGGMMPPGMGGPGMGMPPGMGMGGPGMPGMMPPGMPPQMAGMPGMPGMPGMNQSQNAKSSQVRFLGPAGMNIGWSVGNGYAENQLVAPGRYNFRQARTYRLKLTNIRGRNMTLYPTLKVYPAHPTTDAYLTHNSVPIQLTDEDLDQIEGNNFVTKVVYLPEPKYQELAIAGVKTLVSTRLDPGVDPVAEADKRGTIMAVLRVGNMDLEMPDQNNGPSITSTDANGGIKQTAAAYDGFQGEHVDPMPIGYAGTESPIPSPQMMGAPSYPGRSPYNPVAGMYGAPKWGMPITATPIGLPGPTHLPFGGPAGLKSHTIRNNTPVDLGKPVDHMLVDVKHLPGIKMPHPVKHVEITEKHPSYRPGEVSHPGGGGSGGFCPPGQSGPPAQYGPFSR